MSAFLMYLAMIAQLRSLVNARATANYTNIIEYLKPHAFCQRPQRRRSSLGLKSDRRPGSLPRRTSPKPLSKVTPKLSLGLVRRV